MEKWRINHLYPEFDATGPLQDILAATCPFQVIQYYFIFKTSLCIF